MIKLYVAKGGFYSHTIEVDEGAPIPNNATIVEPPTVPVGKRVAYKLGGWELVDEVKPSPPSAPEVIPNRLLLTTDEFIELIPDDEYLVLESARTTNGQVAKYWAMVMSRSTIDVGSSRVATFLGNMVTANIFSQTTVDTILAGLPAE